jgi:hypothetical protein
MRHRCLALSALAVFLAADFPLEAQYPPGRYPGGGGLPFPRRGKKKTSKEVQVPENLQDVNGMLREMDAESVIVEAKDTRIIKLKRTDKTKFLHNGDEIKPEVLKPGDHLLIEAMQNEEGYFYAVNVILEKEGTAEERAAASETLPVEPRSVRDEEDRPVLRRKDSPPPAEDETKAESATRPTQPAAQASEPEPDRIVTPPQNSPMDESDPGRPRLKRGKPGRRAASTPGPVAGKSAPAPIPVPDPESPAPVAARVPEPAAETAAPPDPRIEKARAVAATFAESLPNYFCRQQMARFVNTSHVVSWRPLDVVSAVVVYENGQEHYRNLEINGKPVKKKMDELSGAWSTGEYASMLADLFSPSTAADFQYRKLARAGNREAYVFDFDVDREHSHWHVQAPSQSILPAYRGAMWIDKETGRVLRIEMQAYALPAEFPMDKVESATDYEYVRIGDRQFLLPVHAETLICQRGTNICSRNNIDFRNYHKYSGEADIKFEQ